jgi:hypothetical protein
MAASRTKNVSNKNPTKQQADAVIQLAAQYISAWTQKEFTKLSANKKIPLIWPTPEGGYIIGHKRIVPHNGSWQLQDFTRRPVHTFDSKQSAIFYCLCDQVKSYHLADMIRITDSEVMRLKNDVIHYNRSLERGIKQKDTVAISIWSARLDDAKVNLNAVQNQLQKSIKSAKYLKVWDN